MTLWPKRALAVCLLGVPLACSGPSWKERYGELTPPRDSFAPVSEVLGGHCGSLDCHGQAGRSLRVYHFNGLRLRGGISGSGVTTAEEHDANFQSVVLLEPEALTAVVSERGLHPEELTLVRKARGREDHKGGAPWPFSSNADRCFSSWLQGTVDVDSCTRAAEVPRPDFP